MESPDVDVLVNASSSNRVHHEVCHRWLHALLASGQPLGISELVLSAVVRILTNRRIPGAVSLPEALQFTNALLAQPTVTRLRPGARHWQIFTGLCENEHITGPKVSDAYHAALAIEHGATWVTLDRDFAAFRWLRTRNLLARPEAKETRARYGVPPLRRRSNK